MAHWNSIKSRFENKQNLGDQGSQISGGQRQRIAIARSFYQNRDILIFDEGNSSYIVDNIIEGGNYVVYNQRPEVLYISFRVIISLLINIKKFEWNLFQREDMLEFNRKV